MQRKTVILSDPERSEGEPKDLHLLNFIYPAQQMTKAKTIAVLVFVVLQLYLRSVPAKASKIRA